MEEKNGQLLMLENSILELLRMMAPCGHGVIIHTENLAVKILTAEVTQKMSHLIKTGFL